MSKKISLAIVLFVFVMVTCLVPFVNSAVQELEGKVTKVSGTTVTINLGQNHGITVGQVGLVFYVITTDQSKHKIDVAKIKITKVFPTYSLAKITDKTEAVQKNFLVSFKTKVIGPTTPTTFPTTVITIRPTVTPTSSEFPQPDGKPTIQEAVICEDVVDWNPVGVNTVFNLQAGVKKKLHFFIRYQGAVPEKTTIQHRWYYEERLIASSNPFTLKYKDGTFDGWNNYDYQQGNYRVDVIFDGEVVRSLNFRVNTSTVTPPTTPPTTGLEITEAFMCEDVVDWKPVNVNTVFNFVGTQRKLYCFVRYKGAVPNKTTIQHKWYYEGNIVSSPNPFVLAYQDGEFKGWFNNIFQPGKYRVELIIDGVVIRSLIFSVTGTSVTPPTTPPPAGTFEFTEVVMCEDVVDWNPVKVNTVFNITPGSQKRLYLFIRYKGAIGEKTTVQDKWYFGDKLIYGLEPYTLKYSAGEYKSWYTSNYQEGTYRVELSIDGQPARTLSFTITSSSVTPPASNFEITEGVVCENVVESNPVGAGNIFKIAGTEKKLFCFVRYKGAVAEKSTFSHKWYYENDLLSSSTPFTIKYAEGNLWGWYTYRFKEGNYRVELLIDGQVIRTLNFRIETGNP